MARRGVYERSPLVRSRNIDDDLISEEDEIVIKVRKRERQTMASYRRPHHAVLIYDVNAPLGTSYRIYRTATSERRLRRVAVWAEKAYTPTGLLQYMYGKHKKDHFNVATRLCTASYNTRQKNKETVKSCNRMHWSKYGTTLVQAGWLFMRTCFRFPSL